MILARHSAKRVPQGGRWQSPDIAVSCGSNVGLHGRDRGPLLPVNVD
jgi:hypothetical protein